MSNTCIAIIQRTGEPCGSNIKSKNKNKKFCKKHDPEYKEKRKRLRDPDVLKHIIDVVYKTIGVGFNMEGDFEDEMIKKISHLSEDDVTSFVSQYYIPRMRNLSWSKRNDDDGSKLYPTFTRRVWMRISHYLEKDPQTYCSVAMTCKTLFGVFVHDKVKYFEHPLKNIIKSPSNFIYPMYRMIQVKIPKHLEKIMKKFEMPSLERLFAAYDRREGRTPQNDFEESKKKARVYVDALTFILRKNLKEGEDIVEEIKGAGIFTNFDPNRKIDMFKSKTPYNIINDGKNGVFVVIKADPKNQRNIEREFLAKTLYCNDDYITRIMKV